MSKTEAATPIEFTEELVGFIAIDTASLALGDPCQVAKLDGIEAGEKLDPREAESYVYGGKIAACNGLVVSTGYGDGYYPVYVTKTPDGRVASVEVEFITPQEAEAMAEATALRPVTP